MKEPSRAAPEQRRNHPEPKTEQRYARDQADHQKWPFEAGSEPMWPQHVIGEKRRQVQDYTHYGRGDRRQRRGDTRLAAGVVSPSASPSIICGAVSQP